MKLPFQLTQDQRQAIMSLTAALKESRGLSYYEMGKLLGTDGTALQRTIMYGRPPAAAWLLWWIKTHQDADVREWARKMLEVQGLIDVAQDRRG